MADFCKQCSIDLFGEDFRDLAGIGAARGEELEPGSGWIALCEGCGPTLVDDNGVCMGHCDKEDEHAGYEPLCALQSS